MMKSAARTMGTVDSSVYSIVIGILIVFTSGTELVLLQLAIFFLFFCYDEMKRIRINSEHTTTCVYTYSGRLASDHSCNK